MSVTLLDENVALIVIDLQKGIVALPLMDSPQQVIHRAGELINAFRKRQKPVVLVNVQGGAPGRNELPKHHAELPSDWSDLIDEVVPQPDDWQVTKRSWGAFAHTTLDEQLRAAGVTQVVICGIATSIGVESTARQAYELGYNVCLVTDAMLDLNAEAHHNSLTRIFPRLGESATTGQLLQLLA